ncbi:MAG: hypothetical protein EA395_11440 [Phormidium sp. GEM2.Bin31]|nr:hypothetical protein [Phormidium sp. BM_Day4_Bin.17]TVR08337.1 MAG: hypothetical protein EA395_11440 [Phormidium sp. GEM2.Bin31]UCJ13727.1 MAG: hypothetical protein JWS08_08280 [Phormidium sp. PBR-2020]
MSKNLTNSRITPQELNDWSQGIFAKHEQELKELASREKLPTNIVVSWWMILFFLIPIIHDFLIDIFPALLDIGFVVLGLVYIAIGVAPLWWMKQNLVDSSQPERDQLNLKFRETYPGLLILGNKSKHHNQIIDHFIGLQESLATRESVTAGQNELLQAFDLNKSNFLRAFEQERQWREASQRPANPIQWDLATLERLQQQTPAGRCRDLLQQVRDLAVNTQRELNQVLS